MSGISFNTSPETVARRYKKLKEASPRKYEEVVESFRDMARGGQGGHTYFNYQGLVAIRGYYFRGWADEDFSRLLSLLGEEL